MVILFTGGIYLFNSRERLTTVTELIAMANPASSGLKVIPQRGYNIPAATGIRTTL
jgi:hypothetical protein